MADRELSKKKFVRLNTEKELGDIQNKFRYYRLALYLYAFASFLDVMLLENYDASYLNSITDRIKDYSKEYESFHSKSVEGVGEIAESSIQSRVLQGVSIAGGFLGKQIAKIPDKGNKITIDDFLIKETDKMWQKQKEAAVRTMDDFSSSGKNGALMFADKIDLVNKLYNEPIRIYFDSKNIYLQA